MKDRQTETLVFSGFRSAAMMDESLLRQVEKGFILRIKPGTDFA